MSCFIYRQVKESITLFRNISRVPDTVFVITDLLAVEKFQRPAERSDTFGPLFQSSVKYKASCFVHSFFLRSRSSSLRTLGLAKAIIPINEYVKHILSSWGIVKVTSCVCVLLSKDLLVACDVIHIYIRFCTYLSGSEETGFSYEHFCQRLLFVLTFYDFLALLNCMLTFEYNPCFRGGSCLLVYFDQTNISCPHI